MKCRFPGSSSSPQNQNLWEWEPVWANPGSPSKETHSSFPFTSLDLPACGVGYMDYSLESKLVVIPLGLFVIQRYLGFSYYFEKNSYFHFSNLYLCFYILDDYVQG